MLKGLLPVIASVLFRASNLHSQDIFSFYFPTNEETPTPITSPYMAISPDENASKGISFGNLRESFVDNYIRVLDGRVSKSTANIYRASARGKEYNVRGAMYGAFADTCMERYQIAIELKKFTEKVKKKTTVKQEFGRRSISSKDDFRVPSYKLLLRPSVRGIDIEDVGLEFVLKNMSEANLALARLYLDHSELKVPLGNILDVSEEKNQFNSFLRRFSLSAKVRYGNETSGSVTLNYESPSE
jgi:hypothetical protein